MHEHVGAAAERGGVPGAADVADDPLGALGGERRVDGHEVEGAHAGPVREQPAREVQAEEPASAGDSPERHPASLPDARHSAAPGSAKGGVMTRDTAVLTETKRTALEWVSENETWLSETTKAIWDLHEPAWREYRSAALYAELLRERGFDVEEGSGGMPTAFRAR